MTNFLSRTFKNALVVGQSTLFKVQEKQSENQLFKATIALIIKEKNAILSQQLFKLIRQCGIGFSC